MLQGLLQRLDKVRLIQQARTEIHRQAQAGAVRVPRPLGEQRAGGAEHLHSQGLDQPTALGDSDKGARRQQAALRVLPAHQRLGTGQAPQLIHLRLQIQQELTVLQPPA